MNFFQNLPFNLLHRKAQNSSGIDPSLKSQQPVVLKLSAPVPSRLKTLAEIEKEIEAQAHVHRTYSYKLGVKKQRHLFSRIFWAAILLGVPIGVIWVANLPYPVIRRPVARNAPILLLPSYISMENNYRQTIVTVEQAQQLVEKASSPADLERGEVKVKQAQKNLDALPIWFINEWSEYNYWWYDSLTAFTDLMQLEVRLGS